MRWLRAANAQAPGHEPVQESPVGPHRAPRCHRAPFFCSHHHAIVRGRKKIRPHLGECRQIAVYNGNVATCSDEVEATSTYGEPFAWRRPCPSAPRTWPVTRP